MLPAAEPGADPPPSAAALPVALLLAALLVHGAVAAPARAGLVVALLLLGTAAALPPLLRGRLDLARDPLDLPLAVLLAVSIPGALASLAPRATRDRLLWDGALVLFALLFARTVRTRRAASVAAAALACGVVLWSGAALLWRGSSFLGVRLFSAPGERLSFTFVNPDHLAALAGAGALLAAGVALSRRGFARVAFGAGAAVALAALLASASRGGFVAVVVASIALAAMVLRRRPPLPGARRLAALALLLFVAGLLVAPARVHRRLATLADPQMAAATRIEIWRGSLAMIAARPLAGWGAGTFEAAFPPFAPDGLAGMTVNRAHSDPLELLAERGLLGGLAAAALLGVAAVALRRRLAGADDREFPVRAGAAAAALALLVQGLADFVIPVPALAMLLVALLHLATGNWGSADGERRVVPLPGGRPVGATLAVAVAGLAAVLVLETARPVAAARKLAEARRAEGGRDLPTALAKVDEARRIDPGHPDAARERARLLAVVAALVPPAERTRRGNPALAAVVEARALLPADGSMAALEGRVREGMGDRDGALAAFDAAIALEPTVPSHHRERGFLLLGAGRREEGEGALRRGLELAPAELPEVMARLEEMGWSADEADAVVPDRPEARRELGRRWSARGDGTRAAFELRGAYEAAPSPALAAEHLSALLAAGRDGEALPFAREYVAAWPLDRRATNAALRVFARLGLFEEAWPVWERRLAAEPENAALRLSAAPVLLRLGRPAEAAALLEEGMRRAPSDPRFPRLRAEVSRRAGEGAEAARWLERAVELAPSDPRLRVELAVAYRLLGNPAAGRRHLLRCLELVPGDAGCAAALAAD